MKGMFNQFNELSRQIHENAVAHGWWEEERERVQLCALFHSELSESFEEYRKGNDYEYEVDGKPEGIAVELADYIIRVLDYAFHMGFDIDAEFKMPEAWDTAFASDDFSRFISDCHKDVTNLYGISKSEKHEGKLAARCITRPMIWMILRGIDPIEVIKRKHAYNRTRPYRHGGKVC